MAKSKASNVEKRIASTKLGRGEELVSTSIYDEHEDILLKQEDIRRWQWAEDLLIENLLRCSDDDWQATIIDRSENWRSIDVNPKTIDWSL